MKIISREGWGARPPVGKRVPVAHAQRTGVVIHHTTGEALGKGDDAAWVRSIQRYHQSVKGWADVGYNFLVAADGTVYEGRGWALAGAHCTGRNTDCWGIALLGDGSDVVPEDALEAIGELLGMAEQRAGHPLTLMGHRDAAKTACPGDSLYAWVHDVEAVGPVTATVAAPTTPHVPAFPLEPTSFYGEGGVERGEGLKRWQSRMAQRGWTIDADGSWGPQSDGVTRAFQAEKGYVVDGRVGKITWAGAWAEPVT